MIKRFKTLLKIIKTDGYRVQNIFYRINYKYSILFQNIMKKEEIEEEKNILTTSLFILQQNSYNRIYFLQQ